MTELIAKPPNESQLFQALDVGNKGEIERGDLIAALRRAGIGDNDPRLRDFYGLLVQEDYRSLDFEKFSRLTRQNSVLIQRALSGDLAIPNFQGLVADIREIYEHVKKNETGHVATYIPQLARVNPDYFSISVCTIDGQRFSIGDAYVPFSLQSVSKPVNYSLALEEHGAEKVFEHIGREPSGHSFNALTLDHRNRPHNPMINAGAIMSCALLKNKLTPAERFDFILNSWERLCGGLRPGFNNAVYLSERDTADRNFALTYFMREKGVLPADSSIQETLELYFQCCSIEVTSEQMSIAAATFAKSGINPFTGERVFKSDTVKDCLSLMYSCGMYDYSGEFAFSIGLPAKSGVSGGLMVVVPNTFGIAIYSPRLDEVGNSVRGVEVCRELIRRYNFHNYDSLLLGHSNKTDPRLKKNATKLQGVMAMCWAAAQGDLNEIQQLVASGVDINCADYDGRTPMHLACSEGHADVVRYFLAKHAGIAELDRWGSTPLDDAKRHEHHEIVTLLTSAGHRSTTPQLMG